MKERRQDAAVTVGETPTPREEYSDDVATTNFFPQKKGEPKGSLFFIKNCTADVVAGSSRRLHANYNAAKRNESYPQYKVICETGYKENRKEKDWSKGN